MGLVQLTPEHADPMQELAARVAVSGNLQDPVGDRAAAHVEVVPGARIAPAEDDGLGQPAPPAPIVPIRNTILVHIAQRAAPGERDHAVLPELARGQRDVLRRGVRIGRTSTTTTAAAEIAAGIAAAAAGIATATTTAAAFATGEVSIAAVEPVDLAWPQTAAATAVGTAAATAVLARLWGGPATAAHAAATARRTTAPTATAGHEQGRLGRPDDDRASSAAGAAVPGGREWRPALGATEAVALRVVAEAADPDVEWLTGHQGPAGRDGEGRLREATEAPFRSAARIAAVRTLHNDLQLRDPLRNDEGLDRGLSLGVMQ
jgi:hypothetical protein